MRITLQCTLLCAGSKFALRARMRTTVLLATVLTVACNTGSVSSRSATRIQDTVRVQIQTDGNPAATIREAVLAHGNVCEGVDIAEREYAEQIRLGASSNLYNPANAQAIAETLAQLRNSGCNNESDGGVSEQRTKRCQGAANPCGTNKLFELRVVGGIGPGEPNVHGNRTFGSNAALSSDGTVMAVADSTAGSNGRGAIWVFRRSSASATWPSPVRIDATDTYQLGSTVALSARGDTLMGCATGGAFAVIYNYVAGSWSQSAIVRPRLERPPVLVALPRSPRMETHLSSATKAVVATAKVQWLSTFDKMVCGARHYGFCRAPRSAELR